MKTVIEMASEAGFTEGELAFMGDNFIRFAELVRADALAEQPAEQCKWPTCQSEEYQQDLAEQIKRELVGEQPAQQQEPVAWVYKDARGHYRYRGGVKNFDKEYSILNPQALYTAPPAQRTWVELTRGEIEN